MTTVSKRRIGEGIFIAGFGAGILALIPSNVKAIPGMETDMSPSFIPSLVGSALLVLGAVVIARAAAGKEKEKPSGLEWNMLKRVLVSAALMLLYALLFPLTGFVSASAVFIGVFSWLFGQRNPAKLAAVMVIVPAAVWILFELVFVIPLPHGVFF